MIPHRSVPFLFAVILALALPAYGPASEGDTPKGEAAKPAVVEYTVGAGDLLDIRAFGEDDLSRTAQVSTDGSITYPLLGRVEVAGLTVRQIEERLTGLLEKDYLVEPHVTILIKEYRSRKVYVLGAVKEPGYYELRGATTLLEILSRAGGVLPEGGKALVVVRGGGNGDVASPKTARHASPENTVVVDAYQLLQEGDTSQNLYLNDRDVVYVPKAKEVFVIGEVKIPGAVVFSEKLTLLQAIGQAGGATELAATRRVQLVRVTDGMKQSYRYNLNDIMEEKGEDVPLRPDDVIVVPKRIF